MSNVYPLYRDANQIISHILRVGHTGHRVFEDLQAAGRMPFRHAVFDASHSLRQHDPIMAGRCHSDSGHGATEREGFGGIFWQKPRLKIRVT